MEQFVRSQMIGVARRAELRTIDFLIRTGLLSSEVVLVNIRPGGERYPQWRGAIGPIVRISED